VLKILIYIVLIYSFTACSTKSRAYSWERTKAAAYIAATDKMTWVPLASGLTLDATGYDDDITNHIMDSEDPTFDEEDADAFRFVSVAMAYTTAVLVPDDNLTLKGKRVLVELLALETSAGTVRMLNKYAKKDAPNGTYDEALGSNHALIPFAASALTRRNVDQMEIANWGKYSINTVSYLASTGSAYERIESGLHSFSDQLYSVAAGNFIALFIHDAFMANDTQLGIDLSSEDPKLTVSIPF